MTNSGFSAEINLEKPDLVFFSVPYDDGFTAYVGGQETEILRVDNGMMAVLCPAGWSSIDFVYSPAGLPLSRTVCQHGQPPLSTGSEKKIFSPRPAGPRRGPVPPPAKSRPAR